MNPFKLGLREGGDEELDSLISKLEPHLPFSLTVRSLLNVGFKRKVVDRNYTRIYVPVSQEVPCFVIVTGVVRTPNRNNLTIFWDPNEISPEEAKKLMKSLPNWDWEQPVLFNNVSIRTLEEVQKIMLGEDGLCNNKLQNQREDGYTYILSEEVPTVRDLPEGFFLRKLSEDFAPIVFKNWHYRCDTEEGFRSYMKSLPSMGIFVKEDSERICNNENENSKNGPNIDQSYKLVAWTITKIFGEIGYTHTLPEYRSKGLCTAVTYALVKELSKINITPFANIDDKPVSIKAHESVGFRKCIPVGYHAYVPEGCSFHYF